MKVKEKAESFCAYDVVMLTPRREGMQVGNQRTSERTVGAALRGRPWF